MRRPIRFALAALIPLVWAGCASSGGGASDATGSGGPAVAAAGAPSATTAGGAPQVELTRVGDAVRLTEDEEETHECEFIAHLPIEPTHVSDTNALRALRNEAGRQGANLVLLVMASRTMIEHAEGYLCAD